LCSGEASLPIVGLDATRASRLALAASRARGLYQLKWLYLSQIIGWHSHATCSSPARSMMVICPRS
jgi:hypothetical protein